MSAAQENAIASAAFDQLQAAKEQMEWLGALIWSIKDSINNGRPEHAQRLAGVANYLAHEYGEYLGNEIETLDRQLIATSAGN